VELTVEAHGGLKRWSQLTTVKSQPLHHWELWQLKAQPEALKDVVVEAQLKRQQLTTHFIRKSRRSVFTPDRVSIESESGILEEGRDDPRSTFQGQRLETPWNDLQMAYFNSHALMELSDGQDEISGFFQFVRDLYPGFVNNPGCGLAV
jgi:hypothetical protein